MARKTVVTLIDDFDRTSAADETVSFGIDGITYEIDLSETNAAELRKTFDQWIPAARRTGRIKGSRQRRPDTSKRSDTSAPRADIPAIRAWARENGHTASTRGRIAADIVTAYDQASA